MEGVLVFADPGWEKRDGRLTVVTRVRISSGRSVLREEELAGDMAETCEKIKRLLAAYPGSRGMVKAAGMGAAIFDRLRTDGLPVVPVVA